MKKNNISSATLKDLVVIDKLTIGPIKLEKKRVVAPYTVYKGKEIATYDFIYTYEEEVFEPLNSAHYNLASMLASQVAINYGLFCKEIVFQGLFDDIDKTAIKDWMENTAREIYVKKFLESNLFLVGPCSNLPVVKNKNYSAAKLEFVESDHNHSKSNWEYWEIDKNKHCILSSGGKDSLLSHGLIDEIGFESYPIFVNESGRHWFTAINAYRYFKENVPNTGRVWVNSDRVFSFMLKQLPFIRKDHADIRSDEYPIRLWTVAIFSMAVLPLLRRKKIGRLIIGDEYDTTVRSSYRGISHYDGLYDQSKYFDEYMSRYFMRKGWAISQFSILRPLSELLIETILAKRYPELQANQVSCHAAHKVGEKIKPCGKCEKCRRIIGMLSAIDINPEKCGYSQLQIKNSLKILEEKSIHQEKAGADQLLIMLSEKGLITLEKKKASKLKEHPEVLHLRFDSEKSQMIAIPKELRKSLYNIFLEYSLGALRRVSRKWENIDPFTEPDIKYEYPFELSKMSTKGQSTKTRVTNKRKYLWAQMSWPEAEDALRIIDTALLPVGAIEQHGPHLPLDVDASDAEYLATSVAKACSDPKPLVLPLISYGVSYHHEDFKGTISITNETLARIVYEIGIDIARQGIKKLIIINGHGDNAPTLSYAAQMINRDAKIFVAVDTGETSDVDLDELTDVPNDVHAGDIETSTTLATRPELVDMNLAKKEVMKFSSKYLNFSSSRGLPWYAHTHKISNSGVMGDPTKADAKKGKKMWEIMIAHLVALVEDVKRMSLDEIHQKKY